MLRSIRGATTVDINEREMILKATEELLYEIIEINNLKTGDIISVLFSCTRDLDRVYPAVAARAIGITEAALMCFDELYVEGSLPMCIRVMVNAEIDCGQSSVKHVYQKKARALRPDITGTEKKYFSIAIDGPSGAGKSTVAKLCAEKLGFRYIDTGAMYRAFAFYCIIKGIDVTNENEVEKIAESIPVEVKFKDGKQLIFCEGEDITGKIRTQQVAAHTSKVSAIVAVRKRLVKMQQGLADGNNVVMDGRDIGTVVLKESPLKIYLDADCEVRAKRRLSELKEAGISADFESVLEEVKEGDCRDMNRKTDPLKKATDAVVIDSGNLSAEEASAMICALARKRMA